MLFPLIYSAKIPIIEEKEVSSPLLNYDTQLDMHKRTYCISLRQQHIILCCLLASVTRSAFKHSFCNSELDCLELRELLNSVSRNCNRKWVSLLQSYGTIPPSPET